jgi:hypothetical protein
VLSDKSLVPTHRSARGKKATALAESSISVSSKKKENTKTYTQLPPSTTAREAWGWELSEGTKLGHQVGKCRCKVSQLRGGSSENPNGTSLCPNGFAVRFAFAALQVRLCEAALILQKALDLVLDTSLRAQTAHDSV